MPSAPRPLLITDDPLLIDRVLAVAGAAGVSLDVAADLRAAAPRWERAACVLIGHDVRPGPGLGPRLDVVMVSGDLDDATVWARAAQLRCEHVVFLPDAEAWLESRLRRAVGAGAGAAPVVAVLGARGGAGASVIASALAFTAARTGWHVGLVDADPQGGGLDLLFSDDGQPVDGPVAVSGSFRGRLDLLVRDNGAGPPQDLGGFLEQVSHSQDLVVVDLPRGDRPRCTAGLSAARTALLVVTAEVRAVVGAQPMSAWVRELCPDLRVVVRTTSDGALDSEMVTQSLELPVAGILPDDRGLQGDLDRGIPPSRKRGHLRRWAEDFLTELGEPVVRVA